MRTLRHAARALVITSLISGCLAGDLELDGQDESVGSLASETITPNRLLHNEEVVGAGGVGVDEVQGLLLHYGSALASYDEDGKSAAQWIVEAGQANDISPIYLLARIETESGLVRSGTLDNLSAATGCGCPDGVPCDPALAGFGLQTLCAAERIRGYLTSLDQTGQTISGWAVDKGKWTSDPCWVVPANRITAALYTYTPWVGAYADSCGTSQWGGASLVAVLTRKFQDALGTLDDCSLGDGLYCGGNGVSGDADGLYECQGGNPALVEICPAGCEPMPAGYPDRCREPEEEPIVIDSDHSANDPAVASVEMSSSWHEASSATGYFGSGYAYAGVAPVSDPAVFWFYLDAPGTRTIDAWWTAGGNRSSAAPFLIEDADGKHLATVKKNQRISGGQWNELGSFQFTKGWNRVRLSRWAVDGDVVIADAIQIR